MAKPSSKSLSLAAAAVTAQLSLGGCAVLSSRPPTERAGVEYYLPKAMVRLTLAIEGGAPALQVGALEYVADTSAGAHVLSYVPSSFAGDKTTLKLEANGLLNTVSSDADDRMLEIATAAGKTLGTFSGFESAARGAAASPLYSVVIDPTDETALAEAAAGMTRALRTWGRASGGAPEERANRQAATGVMVTITSRWVGGIAPAAAARPAPSCERGICVRTPRPLLLQAAVDGQPFSSNLLNIPNGAPRTVLPIERTVFADQKVALSLSNGMLLESKVEKGSEVEGLLTLPAALVAAYLDQIVSVFQKRTSAVAEEEKYRDALEAANDDNGGDDAGDSESDVVPGARAYLPGFTLPPRSATPLVNNVTGTAGGRTSPSSDGQSSNPQTGVRR